MLKRGWTLGVVGVCVLGVWLASGLQPAEAAEKPGSYHKNEAWGFKVRTPAKWNVIHMSTKEKWIALKAIGPRDLYGPKGAGWGMRPEMWVIAFPADRQKNRGAKREKIDGEENSFRIWVENPYKNYKDFVKREKRLALGSAGFYFSKEEQEERGGLKIDVFEIKVEKMTDTPFRMVAWVWHTKDVSYAIQFKIPENHYESYAATFKACLRSFKEIARTQAMPGSGTTTGPNIMDVEREKDMSPEQRKQKRIEDVERYVVDEVGNLPKGWIVLKDKQFVVISHGDKKFTKRVLTHAGLIRKYLEKHFPGLGDDHVPRSIIRIFKDNAERSAFQAGTSSIFLSDLRQIMLTSDRGFSQLWEFESLSGELLEQWVYYKNRNLHQNMPYWLQRGLTEHIRQARPSKSKGLRFAPDVSTMLSLMKFAKTDKVRPIRDIFSGAPEEEKEDEDGKSPPPGLTGLPPGITFGGDSSLQTNMVFHYMMMKGSKGNFKGGIRLYLATLMGAIEEEDKKFEAEEEKRRLAELEEWRKKIEKNGGKIPEDEDDEDEDDEESLEESQKRWEDYAKRLEAKRQAISERCFGAAFGHITDKEWRRLDRKWLKWAEKGGK